MRCAAMIVIVTLCERVNSNTPSSPIVYKFREARDASHKRRREKESPGIPDIDDE